MRLDSNAGILSVTQGNLHLLTAFPLSKRKWVPCVTYNVPRCRNECSQVEKAPGYLCVALLSLEGMAASEVPAAHGGHDDEVLCEGGQGVSSVSSIFDPYL